MVSAQSTSFSAAPKAQHSPTLVAPSESDSAAEQFVNVLDQLLGKSTKVSKADSFNDLDVKPAVMLYREKEEAAPVKEKEKAEVKADDAQTENTETNKDTPLDATTTALLAAQVKSAEKKDKTVEKVGNQEVTEKAETKAAVKVEVAQQQNAFTQEKQAVSEAFKLIKQVQTAKDRPEVTQSIDQLQEKLEDYFKTQPEKALAASQAANSGVESDLKIEKFNDLRSELKDIFAVDTKPNALKASILTSTTVATTAAPVLASTLSEKLTAELASLASRGSVGTKLLQELSKEREPVASLSLLGDKSKVQTPKETGKSNQLTSRQEQIINQILKVVEQAAKSKDGSTLSIRVKPEELGEVLVKVSQRGDQMYARIIPEHKEVEHTVRSGINEVIAQLVAAGFKPENIHVAVGKELTESESFGAFHHGLGNQGSDQGLNGQNLLGNGDRHGSSLSNPDSSGSKSDSKNALTTLNDAVDNGWVA